MSWLPNRIHELIEAASRAWIKRFPRFSLRILLVLVFTAFILFSTRPPAGSRSLTADRSHVVTSAQRAPAVPTKPRVYAWLSKRSSAKTSPLVDRLPAPSGWARVQIAAGGFADWLRHLPTWPEGMPVTSAKRQVIIKADDPRIAAVVALQPGSARVLDAANMLIRLRGEYLWATEQTAGMAFHFTSGHASEWPVWAAGGRPQVRGRNVDFRKERPEDASRDSFCSYLETIFQYSSPYSILADTKPADDLRVTAGDIFLNPSTKKGCAVMVLDVAQSAGGAGGGVKIMLGCGGTPPQTFHVLRSTDGSPWFDVSQSHDVVVPGRTPLRLKDLRHWK